MNPNKRWEAKMIFTIQATGRDIDATHQLSGKLLKNENRRYENTGGVSEKNRSFGFIPAFLDTATGTAYQSNFSDGSPAPMHLLDGLPRHLLISNHDELKVRNGVISGFLHCGEFLTRSEAAAALTDRFQA
jgi:hypothetical protein